MGFVVEDGETLCSIEEKGQALAELFRTTKSAIEFALLASARDTVATNAAINVSAQVDRLIADFEARETELRGFIARYRLRAKWVSF